VEPRCAHCRNGDLLIKKSSPSSLTNTLTQNTNQDRSCTSLPPHSTFLFSLILRDARGPDTTPSHKTNLSAVGHSSPTGLCRGAPTTLARGGIEIGPYNQARAPARGQSGHGDGIISSTQLGKKPSHTRLHAKRVEPAAMLANRGSG